MRLGYFGYVKCFGSLRFLPANPRERNRKNQLLEGWPDLPRIFGYIPASKCGWFLEVCRYLKVWNSMHHQEISWPVGGPR